MGPQQTTAFLEVIKRLTTHPVLVLPDWNQPFTLHIDANTLTTEDVLRKRWMAGAGMDLWDITASASHERSRMPQLTIVRCWTS